MAVVQDRLRPAARAIVDQFARMPPLSQLTPEEARGAPTPLAVAPEPVASVIARSIPGPGGAMAVRIYRPMDALPAALVYFHGGGWVLGSLEGADESCRMLANRGRVVVISVAYRLAPETKFPGPVEDAYTAVVWVAEHASELGIDPAKVAVGGSSAGGNLAAVASLVARDRGGPTSGFAGSGSQRRSSVTQGCSTVFWAFRANFRRRRRRLRTRALRFGRRSAKWAARAPALRGPLARTRRSRPRRRPSPLEAAPPRRQRCSWRAGRSAAPSCGRPLARARGARARPSRPARAPRSSRRGARRPCASVCRARR